MTQRKAKLVKRDRQVEKPVTIARKRQLTANEIRAKWLSERKQTTDDIVALRRKLLGR